MSKELSRKMRHNMTGPERKVWRVLQELKPLGYHFRRQVPVGRYYADFACHHANLIIEVDGDTHGDDLARAYDTIRDEFLHGEGYDVMRLSNDDVVHNWGGVLMAIEQVLADRPRSPVFGATPTPNLAGPPHSGVRSGLEDVHRTSSPARGRPSPPQGGEESGFAAGDVGDKP